MPDYERAARRAAKREGIDPDIFVAQLRQESGLKMGLTSRAGARDIAQFMPGTAKSYGVTLGDGRASDDLAGAARHMRDNLKMFGGDIKKALAAYNAGPGAVRKYGGVPPYRETQDYVKNILAAAGTDGTSERTSTAPKPRNSTRTTTQTVGGVDNKAARGALVASFLQGDTRFTKGTSADGMDAGDPLGFALAMRSLKDVPGQTVTTRAPSSSSKPAASDSPSSSTGDFKGRADAINAKKLPYKWGGGHGGKVDAYNAEPLDCSGAVSAVLGINPRVSGQFTSWGKAGDGGNKGVTVYANAKHVLMKIDGHFFGTSASNPGGGAGWIPQGQISREYLSGFTARHV